MKILMLDNDGVICLSNNWGGRAKKWAKYRSANPDVDFTNRPIDCRFDAFDEKAIKVLNEILEETGAEIVISSDWRLHANLEELGDYYISQGIIKRPIAVTDMFKDIFPREWNAFRLRADLEIERSMEIGHWLKNHPEVTHWVAIDDLHMGIHVEASSYGPYDRDWGLENFVWTPRDWEGIKQSGVKEKIIKFLTNEEHTPDIQG